MNKKNKERKANRRKRRIQSNIENKKLERETYHLEQEVRKMQTQGSQIVNEKSESEHRRIALSLLPKEKTEVSNIREYRKERKKRLKNGTHRYI
jgi:hypothetical protein